MPESAGFASIRRRHQPKFSSTVEQIFDGGGTPSPAAARRSLMHRLELRPNLFEREFRIGAGDAGDKRDQPVACGLAFGGLEERRIGEVLGDEAFDGAFQLFDGPARRGRGPRTRGGLPS